MADTTLLNRVYDLKIAGFDDSLQKVKTLTKAFNDMDSAKKKLNAELQKKTSAGDTAAIQQLTAKLKELEAQMKNISVQREKSAKEASLQAKAEKELAAAELLRTKNLIEQEKELDRIIAAEERKAKADAKVNQSLKEQANNYYALLRAQKEALELYRITPSTSPFFEQVKRGAVDAKAKVDAFNRSLSPDGTLVGEYKSGIINAFKNLGLSDIIKKQRDDLHNELNKLGTDSQRLAEQLRTAGQSGDAAFSKIDAQLRQNILHQEQLRASLGQIDASLNQTGSIGGQITGALSNEFKNLKTNIAQVAVGYVGFQAVVQGIGSVFNNTVKLDSLKSSLSVVSISQNELAVNQEYLKSTTHQLGLEYISTANAFKNFYAASTQAGISADETRKIFFSASAAAANLKLSQEDANGVLLAFSQIASKGKVQAEELRGQIGERVPGAFSIAAKAMGVTQQELNKMLETGQVVSNEFLPKFAAELQKTFGGDATKKVEGLQASINGLKNKFTELLVNNQAGLSSFFSFLINSAGVLLKLLPLLVISLGLYTAEQIRAYLATQLTTKGTILYTVAMYAQRAATFIANTVLLAYYGTIALLTGGLTRATAVTTIFGNAMKGIPLGVILTAIGLIAGAIAVFAKNVTNATKALGENALKHLALAEVQRQSSLIYAEQIAKINSWVAVIKSASTSADTKKHAVEELTKINSLFGNVIKDNVIDLKKLDEAYKAVTDSIIKQATVQASANITAAKQQKLVNISTARQLIEQGVAQKGGFYEKSNSTDVPEPVLDIVKGLKASTVVTNLDFSKNVFVKKENSVAALQELAVLEKAATEEFLRYNAIKEQSEKDLQNSIKSTSADTKNFEVDIASLKKKIEDLTKEIDSFRGSKTDLTKKIAERKRLQEELDKLLGDTKKEKAKPASKLTGAQKDDFKDIDASRDQLIAQQKLLFGDLVIDEQTYLQNILRINTDAADAKLKLLKGKNAEEKKTIAELQLYKIEQAQDTNKKLFDIESKQLTGNTDEAKSRPTAVANYISSDPNKTSAEKLQAQQNLNFQLLAIQMDFNKKQEALELKYGQRSEENERKRAEAIKVILRAIKNARNEEFEADIKTIDEKAANEIAEIKLKYDKLAQSVLNNKKTSAPDKQANLTVAGDAKNLELAAKDLDIANKKLKFAEANYQAGKITKQVYEQYYNDAIKAQQALNAEVEKGTESINSLKDALSQGIKKAFGVKKGSSKDKALGMALAEAYSVAQDAMNNYFDAERNRIEQAKELALQRIDFEKEQRLAQATSAAEKESIERQAMAQKLKAEQEAGEKLKKMKKAQAKIAFLTELGNIWSSVWSVGNPYVAIVLGAIMTGLAAVRYSSTIKQIETEKFAGGGKVIKRYADGGAVEITNGKISNTPNIPTQPNGDNIFATVKTGEVILNKKQQQALGGDRVFASIGVPGFAAGGYTGLGDFNMGDNLKAPYNPASFLVNGQIPGRAGNDTLSELKAMIAQTSASVAQTSNQLKNLKVQVVAKEVIDIDNKQKKAAAIGTI